MRDKKLQTFTDTENIGSQNQEHISFITKMPIQLMLFNYKVYNITILIIHSSRLATAA